METINKENLEEALSSKEKPKSPQMTKETEIGFHQGTLNTLVAERNELFKMIPKNTHNALIDILLCMRCYCKIELNMDISRINRTIRTMLKETH